MEEDGLHQRLIDGDDLALGEVYDRFGALVFGLSMKITSDHSLAEEVTQETFLALWQAPSAFDPTQGTLRSWLCLMAHRRSVDAIRRNESQKKRIEAMASATIDVTVGSPEGVVVERAMKIDVQRAIDMLPADQQQAVKLAYFDGLTFCQVAEVLQIPEGTAKSRIRLATKRLAALLSDAGVQLEEAST